MQSTTIQNLIDKYIDNNGQDGLAEYVTSTLYQENEIKQKIAKLQKRKQEEQNIYHKTIKAIDIEIGTLQIECPHWETQFYNDPAGGSDSHTECLICGKELTNKQYAYDG